MRSLWTELSPCLPPAGSRLRSYLPYPKGPHSLLTASDRFHLQADLGNEDACMITRGDDARMATEMERTVEIQSGEARLGGILGLPDGACGVVAFAHGSGSGRFSPRNQYVARVLREGGVGTLLMDLLEEWESDDRSKVFDIPLLAERLMDATNWLREDPETRDLAIGYFGASTGAAAALEAAAKSHLPISAIVSRGGRPDLAMEYLPRVKSPTLLIVGGDDRPVIGMNREAFERLTCEKEMVIVPGASHLFEAPGTLEEVARLAREWFENHLVRQASG